MFARDGDWFIAYSPETPGANGQGHTRKKARQSLAEAIELIPEDLVKPPCEGCPPTLRARRSRLSEPPHRTQR